MAIIGQDTFNRPDQSGWGISSGGQTWAQLVGAQTLAIASGDGTATSGIYVDNWLACGSFAQADTEILFRFKYTDSANDVPGAMFRHNGASTAGATNAYRVVYNGVSLGIRRVNLGTATTLGTNFTFSVSNNTFYWIRANIIGSTLQSRIWKDGNAEPNTWQVAATDTTPLSAAGYYGLYSIINTTSTDVISFDSFTATNTLGDPLWHRPRYIMRAIAGSIFTPFQAIPAWVDRALTANFVRQTQPVNIPRYVIRAFGSTLINYGLNIATRFRLMSADQLKDISTRFILVGGTQSIRDIATRFRLMQQSVRYVATRFRLKSADQLKDIATRFRLAQQSVRDIATRFRLKSADQLKDIATRFRLAKLNDIATRFRLAKLNDIKTRFRLMSTNQLKDISTRFLLAVSNQSVRDIATRFRLMSANQLKDVATRFRLAKLKDIASRFRLMSANQLKDIATRFRLMSASQLKDIATRFRLKSADQLKDIATRLRLMSANQLKDVKTRLRLMSASQLKDISTRFRLFTIGSQNLRDIACRLVLIAPSDVTWVTRDMLASWKTRDDFAAWKGRDDAATWDTRDDQATWGTRDDQMTWKTRR